MYIVVATEFNAGDHVPVMLLFEVVGKADSVAPEHILGIAVKAGVVFSEMVKSL